MFIIYIGTSSGGGTFPLGYYTSTYIYQGNKYATGSDRTDKRVKKYKSKKRAENAIKLLKTKTINVGYGNIEETIL